MPDPQFLERLETQLGAAVLSTKPLPVGFGLAGLALTLKDGRRLAVKARTETGRTGPSLALEGYMLGELARLSDLPVPEVYVCEPNLLVMDFIENDGHGTTPDAERHAAALIARLHMTPRPHFGYERDTLIGPLHQPNPRHTQWVPFFRDHRLLHMAQAAQKEGRLPAGLLDRIETLAARLDAYLTEPPFPSVLHGDLWSGNVLVRGNRIAGFVDPAIYCGHLEIELAFASMFGTFGKPFFDAYENIAPLELGFHAQRRDLYNLYPLLVHVRLFGASYVGPIDRTLTSLGL